MTETLINAPKKSKQILNRLINSRQITQQGLRYLEVATDPFHDVEVDVDGFPDVSSARVIVQKVRRTFSISLGGSSAWSCFIFFLPLTPNFYRAEAAMLKKIDKMAMERKSSEKKIDKEKERTFLPGTRYTTFSPGLFDYNGVYHQSATPDTVLFAGWNVIMMADNGDWAVDNSFPTGNGSYPEQFCGGTNRLLATGLEAVNTTAELYKGGAVTVWKGPSRGSQITGTVDQVDLAPITWSLVGDTVLMPPTSLENATLYPNSKTWAASKGVYLIAPPNSTENPMINCQPKFSGAVFPNTYLELVGSSQTQWEGFFPTLDADVSRNPNLASVSVLPFDEVGATFSGLHPSTTLQITTEYYFERTPTVAEPDLLVLARLPCPYDPLILEILSRATFEMPPGVPVGENPKGEWFNSVMQAVADWAPSVGAALSVINPAAGTIANGFGMAARGAAKNWDSQKSKKFKGNLEKFGKPAPIPNYKNRLRNQNAFLKGVERGAWDAGKKQNKPQKKKPKYQPPKKKPRLRRRNSFGW